MRLGGIASPAPHPAAGGRSPAGRRWSGSPRRPARLRLQRALLGWDKQFYPAGLDGWVAKLDVGPDGGLAVDTDFFTDFDGRLPHQIRLEGGDASSDSYCFP